MGLNEEAHTLRVGMVQREKILDDLSIIKGL